MRQHGKSLIRDETRGDIAAIDLLTRNVFFALSFDGHIPKGTVTFHEAFKATGPLAS